MVLHMFNFFGKKPESVLEDRLRSNPYFPFETALIESTGTTVYVCTVRNRNFFLSLIATIFAAIFTVVWPTIGENVQYCFFSITILFIGCFYTLDYYPLRTIIHDPTNKYFTVYRGRTAIASNPVYEIFLRMHYYKTGGHHLYSLVMDGLGFDLPVLISNEATNKRKLRHLAQQIATKVEINYFDIHDHSKHHVIIHDRAPDRSSTTPSLI